MTRTGLGRDRTLRAGVLLIFAVLVCARMPQIILKGRFWAEEGRFFFHDAWVMPPLTALLTPVGGYLNIVANAAALAARWLMPLGLAPYLTITVALLFQLCPPFLILTARDGWLRSSGVKILGCLLLLSVPASEELWLQTLHSQFELTLCCAIVTSLEATTGWLAFVRCVLLFLSPLCGPGSVAVLPVLFVRAAVERSRARITQAAALAAGAAIQLGLFFRPVPGRSYGLHPTSLLCIFTIRHLAVPLAGIGFADRLSASIQRSSAEHLPIDVLVLSVAVFVPFGLATLLQRRPRPAFWLLSSGVLIAALSYYGAIGRITDLINPRYGARYSFVQQALFGLAALALAMTASGWIARLSLLAVVWLIVVGAAGFVHPWAFVADGPSWRQQITIWRTDHTHPVQLWPPGWSVTLEGRYAQ